MTVGQPEINLNSWGIRYVKVKQSPTAELDKDPKEPTFTEPKTGEVKETKRETTSNTGRTTPNSRQQPSDIASRTTSHLSDLDVETGIPADRQSDSAGDKDVKVGGHASRDVTTGGTSTRRDLYGKEQQIDLPDNERKHTTSDTGGGYKPEVAQQVHSTVDSKGKPHYSSGSRKRETIGANTSDDPTVGSTQGGKGSKTLTSGQHGTQSGKKGVPKWYAPSESTSTGNVGSNVGHDSGIKNPDADKKETGITNRPTSFKKPKEGEGGTQQSGAKYDERHIKDIHEKELEKAIMDMNIAILKCKNFKMKRIAYSSGGDFGRRYPSRYGDENTHDAGIDDLRYSKRNSQAVQSKTETLAPDRKDETEVPSYGEGATGKHESDKKLDSEGKIVEKAIELINEAYAQIGKDALDGKGVNTPHSKFTHTRTDNTDLDSGGGTRASSTSNLRDHGTESGTPRDYELTSEGKNTRNERGLARHGTTNRPTPSRTSVESERLGGEPQTSVEQSDEVAYDDSSKQHNRLVDRIPEDVKPNKLPEREGKGALDKADSAVTTGTEGTNNPVMAGKKNSKSRKQYNDWYKEEVTNQT